MYELFQHRTESSLAQQITNNKLASVTIIIKKSDIKRISENFLVNNPIPPITYFKIEWNQNQGIDRFPPIMFIYF